MTEQERYKFATYMRDATNLDYANQRYYSSTIGRFLTPDPYVANSSLAEHQSWNRYAYVVNDPVNFLDPSGLMRVQDCVLHPEYCQGAPPADWFRHGGAYAPERRQPPPSEPVGRGGGGQSDPIEAAGGDGATDQAGYDRGITENSRAILQRRIDRLGDCARILGGASISDFSAVASRIQYYDGRPNSPGSGRTQNDVVRNGITASLAATVQYHVAQTLRSATGQLLGSVVLGRDYYGDPTISQAETLLHEALHVALNLSDPDLKKYLARYGFKATEAGSHDITDWLKKDCPK